MKKKLTLIVLALATLVVIGTKTDVLASSGIIQLIWDPEPCVCG